MDDRNKPGLWARLVGGAAFVQGRDLAALEARVHELERRVASLETSAKPSGETDQS